MPRMLGFIAIAIALFAGAVFYAVHLPPKPRGYSGLQFSPLTAAAAARAPLLPRGGALVLAVEDDSPAAKARVRPGTILAAIDGVPIISARQASDMVRRRAAGDRIMLTLFDIAKGEVKPRNVVLAFDAAPPVTAKLSVRPPRTLAKEYFQPPGMTANASWSRGLARGASIRPRELAGIGDGHCNGFTPEDQEWEVRGHAPDDSLFHVASRAGFSHALFFAAPLAGNDPAPMLTAFLEKTFGSIAVLTPPQSQPFGTTLVNFGNRRGATGFVLYRVTGARIAVWIAAVPGADMAWARPIAGAVALSLHCAAPGAPVAASRPPALPPTSVSAACIDGKCGEGDLAGAYMKILKLGYVHNRRGQNFLVNPRRDLWQTGAEGPGFYHQIGGENEKLEPGRTN